MTVKELIKRLENYNPNEKVCFFYFDDDDPNKIISIETDEVGIFDENDYVMIGLLKTS